MTPGAARKQMFVDEAIEDLLGIEHDEFAYFGDSGCIIVTFCEWNLYGIHDPLIRESSWHPPVSQTPAKNSCGYQAN